MFRCAVAVAAVFAATGAAATSHSSLCHTTRDISYPCDTTTCTGYLAYKPGHCTATKKCPTVLIFHDRNGMNVYEKTRARMLADMGYVAFAADNYGAGVPVANLQDWIAASGNHRGNQTLYLNKMNAALSIVKTFDMVDLTKVAVIGYCFGGSGVIDLSIAGTSVINIKGVVSFHGHTTADKRDFVNRANPKAITWPVVLYSGGKDDHAPDIAYMEQDLEITNATYEIVRYGHNVVHAFTEWTVSVPPIAQYEARSDYRSWEGMKLLLNEWFTGLPAAARQATGSAVTTSSHEYPCDTTTCTGHLAQKSTCSATSKCPAVVVIQDWNGMNAYEKERANMVADLGYVGFAADIYGKGTPVQNMRDWQAASSKHHGNSTLYMNKISAAIAKVKSLAFVDTTKIAVIGYCFGGTGAINLALMGHNVLGVVGYHSGLTSRFKRANTFTTPIKAKILIHSGVQDDKATDIAALEAELEKANATFEIQRFGQNVVHSFTEWTSNVPGQAMYNHRADYRSWESTKLFLNELFNNMPTPASTWTSTACPSSTAPNEQSSMTVRAESYQYFTLLATMALASWATTQ